MLTQDGRIARQLDRRGFEIEKEYLVRVRYDRPGRSPGRLPAEKLKLLRHGLHLDGHALRPAQVSWQNDDQLRCADRWPQAADPPHVRGGGLKVVGLKRVRIGRVRLGDLLPGQWRYLQPGESL